MPEVDLPDNLQKRLEAFKPLLEAVLEEQVSLEFCIQVVLERGLALMLTELIGSLEPHVLLASFQQLAAQHPDAVYGFVAETMKAGAAIERENARHRMGFAPPPDS
jgi:hypothetical protein